MANIEINGKSYNTENMSADAKKMFSAVQVAETAIKRTQAQLMLAQTAKNTYLKNLEQLLNK